MKFEIRNGNLFEVEKEYYFFQCISADCAMGKGIALQFNMLYGTKEKTLPYREAIKNKFIKNGAACIKIDRVINLVTKEKYSDKPTYESITKALKIAKKICISKNIKKIAMPKIGCGLDRLDVNRVIDIIKFVFEDTDMELVMYIK